MGLDARAEPSGPVRNLDPAREQAILDATLQLLTEVGFDRMSVDEIARRARASKATIYRRWAGKAALVAAVVERLAADHPPLPDTGSLHGDLTAGLSLFCRVAERKHGLLLGLLPAIRDDAELAALLREHVTEPGTAEARALLGRASARGELRKPPDPDVFLEVVEALVWRRLLVTGEPLDELFVTRAVDLVVMPLIEAASR